MPVVTNKESENKELTNTSGKKQLMEELSKKLIAKLKVKEEPVRETKSKIHVKKIRQC
jgi:hypothetical protein